MSQTDSPLKKYVRENVVEIASWLLDREVISAEHHPLELPRRDFKTDSAFLVDFEDGSRCLFHLEFQGRRTKSPMMRRQLNYLTLFALEHEWPLQIESFVIYVERGAGKGDTGKYELKNSRGETTLAWKYTPIRLWEESAEKYLDTFPPAIMPFTALMQIERPVDATVGKIVNNITAEPDDEVRDALLYAFFTLLDNERILKMYSQLMEEEELFTDTAFQRMVKRRVQANTTRNHVLKLISERFNPPVKHFNQIESELSVFKEETALLEELFLTALTATTLETFETALSAAVSSLDSDD